MDLSAAKGMIDMRWPFQRSHRLGKRAAMLLRERALSSLVESEDELHPGWETLAITRGKDGGLTLVVSGLGVKIPQTYTLSRVKE